MTNQSERGGSGNFANDPQKASEAGRKGGQQSHSGGTAGAEKGNTGGQQEQKDRSGGQQQGGNAGSFKDDPDKAREAGRKGGQQSHGGK